MDSKGTLATERLADARGRRRFGPGIWLMLLVVLVAFGLRLWHLGTQSLWVDEGISALISARPVSPLLSTVIFQDLHPPAYYLALHYWTAITGNSEFALRFLSAATGLLTIPAIYQMARLLLLAGRNPRLGAAPVWGGGLAAALAALSPFLVFYSQEARNYMMVTALTVLASVALWKAHETGPPTRGRGSQTRWWVAYTIFASLTLYVNYFGAFVLIAHVTYLALVSLRRRRFPVMGAGSLAAVALLYLPWLKPGLIQLLRIQTTPDFWAGSISLQTLVERLFLAFSLGPKAQVSTPALVAFAFIVGIGLVSLVRIKQVPLGRSEVFLLLYLLVPVAAIYLMTARAPKFTERYLIMAAPAFYLLIARGLAFLLLQGRVLLAEGKRRGHVFLAIFAIVTVGVLSPSGYFTVQILNSPDFIRDNNRAATAYVEAYSKPGDVIVLMMDAPQAFQYYYKGDLPWYGIQPSDDFQTAATQLNGITQGKERLWLYLWNQDWADPAGFVLDSLEDAAPRALPDKRFPGVEVRTYSLAGRPQFSADFKPQNPISANFEDKVELLGYDQPKAPIAADAEGLVTLYWKALQPLKEEYVVSLRIKGGGYYWGNREVRPTSYFYPTTSWRTGVPIRGRVAISPLTGTPPGKYQLEVAFHSVGLSGGGRDLAVLGERGQPRGTSIIAGTIEITGALKPPSASDLGMDNSEAADLGAGVSLIGAQTPARMVRPGDTVPLTLFWKASGQPLPAQHAIIFIEDSQGKRSQLYDSDPVQGAYPTDRWQIGEVVRGQYSLSIPANVSPGPATLKVALAGTSGSQGQAARATSLEIQERARLMTRPDGIQHPVAASLDDTISLAGYSLSSDTVKPGGTLRLVLYWQALQQPKTAYTVFTHLLDSQNTVRAQQDNPPMRGASPTTAWIKGEYVRDEYDLAIDPAAASGDYVLEVGMYDSATLKRLPVTDGGKPSDDRIILGTLHVKP